MSVLAAKTAGNSPVLIYSAQVVWDRCIDISNKRAPDVVNLIYEHPDIAIRQTALNLPKLEIDIEAFGIKYGQRGINNQEQGKRKNPRCQI